MSPAPSTLQQPEYKIVDDATNVIARKLAAKISVIRALTIAAEENAGLAAAAVDFRSRNDDDNEEQHFRLLGVEM